ncbi:tripartite tricarboxylate transporter TctB family protein [Zobellella iuensis]|jgi:putative tricarboxylic transport membrane protein|uniref:Tripartite tricarboxylate transporter TctB family protein n=1 Tax=Zobellella iuensis TaxID=2803811 RepID=A0ABS1QMP6_9GAMM|nr:tripartite tricarboxylate transporter TctB family protein [Zobellella iuensis]MBL1375877.1 tripartite tricarboxylate transporter TctB family protein [Zobellella iuensis]
MKKTRKLHPGERLISWLLLLFSLFLFHQAYRISGFGGLSTPGIFPLFASGVMVACMLYLVCDNWRIARAGQEQKSRLETVLGKLLPLKIVLFTLMIVGYMLLLQPLGFLLCTFLFLVLSFLYLGRLGLVKAILIAAGAVGAIYAIFHYLFQVVLP